MWYYSCDKVIYFSRFPTLRVVELPYISCFPVTRTPSSNHSCAAWGCLPALSVCNWNRSIWLVRGARPKIARSDWSGLELVTQSKLYNSFPILRQCERGIWRLAPNEKCGKRKSNGIFSCFRSKSWRRDWLNSTLVNKHAWFLERDTAPPRRWRKPANFFLVILLLY